MVSEIKRKLAKRLMSIYDDDWFIGCVISACSNDRDAEDVYRFIETNVISKDEDVLNYVVEMRIRSGKNELYIGE